MGARATVRRNAMYDCGRESDHRVGHLKLLDVGFARVFKAREARRMEACDEVLALEEADAHRADCVVLVGLLLERAARA